MNAKLDEEWPPPHKRARIGDLAHPGAYVVMMLAIMVGMAAVDAIAENLGASGTVHFILGGATVLFLRHAEDACE